MPAPLTPPVVNGFTVLPVRYPATKAFPVETTHYLFLQPHAPRIPTEDTARQLFLVNLPIDATLSNIRSLFADKLGGARVEQIAFEGTRAGRGITAPITHKKKRKRGQDDPEHLAQEVGALPSTWDRELHQSGSTAVVTFVDKASAAMAVQNARKAIKLGTKIVWLTKDADVPALGRARYLSHQKLKFPPAQELQASVDAYMTTFSAAEAERARALARQRAEPDEDGFITVVRGGRAGPAREEETKAKEEELKQREKNRVKEDFYRFQVREKRKAEAQKLVNNFEDDRKRVEAMRQRRGKIRPE